MGRGQLEPTLWPAAPCKNVPLKRDKNRKPAVEMNDDVMTGILMRLPIESVPKFRRACKRFLSLASRLSFSGLLFREHRRRSPYRYLPLRGEGIPISCSLMLQRENLLILHSCNGLLLCQSSVPEDAGAGYVLDPITLHCTRLPMIYPYESYAKMHLAHHESGRPDSFTVVAYPTERNTAARPLFVYTSELRAWRRSRCSVSGSNLLLYAYLDGVIYWANFIGDDVISFDAEKDRMWTMPKPKPPARHDGGVDEVVYFGATNGRLYLVESYVVDGKRDDEIHVFMMRNLSQRKRKGWCTEWSLIYSVNLNHLISSEFNERAIFWPYGRYAVLHLVRGNGEDLLVMKVRGKIISYDLRKKTAEEIGRIFSSSMVVDFHSYTSTPFSC